jgi:LacI family transcriptional regulator
MPRKKNPTIYDVAERSGISISTISRVLNNPEKVNPKTRALVLESIDRLGFVPKAEARARALSQTHRIGVITPFFTEPSFVQRLRGVASALAASHYELVIYTVDSSDRLQGYFSSIPFTGNLDGLIVMSLPIQKKDAQRLIEHKIETVLIEYSHPQLNCIEIDDVTGGRMAGEHLLNKGHRRIAFIGAEEQRDFELHPIAMRLKGFEEAMKTARVKIPAEYICLFEHTQEQAMNATGKLLRLPTPPTAIFAAADVQALSAIKVAREMGVKIPEQLAIVGFDDIDTAQFMDLTTIRQHLDDSGQLAVEILLDHIANPALPAQHVKLPLNLIERKTT